MAKYTITHSCGHTETVQIYGTNVHGERDRKIAWLESKPCIDCIRAQKLEESRKAGLKELSGSLKQVSWVTDIRNDMIKQINDLDEAFRPHVLESATNIYNSIISDMRNNVLSQTSASWFIDHRIYDAEEDFTDRFKNSQN